MKPQRMLISSYKLNNGIVITPLLKFYLKLGLRCTKIYRFVEYTPQKCFNDFVQSVVDARRKGDENLDSSVVAETMKLLGNSSYGYQIMDRSRHTEPKLSILMKKKRIKQLITVFLEDSIAFREISMKLN